MIWRVVRVCQPMYILLSLSVGAWTLCEITHRKLNFHFLYHVRKRCYSKYRQGHWLIITDLNFERRTYFFTLSNAQPRKLEKIYRFEESVFERKYLRNKNLKGYALPFIYLGSIKKPNLILKQINKLLSTETNEC